MTIRSVIRPVIRDVIRPAIGGLQQQESDLILALFAGGEQGAYYVTADGDNPISSIAPRAGTFGPASQSNASNRPQQLTIGGVAVAQTDHVDDFLTVPVDIATGDLIIETPHGWMHTRQNFGAVDARMPLVWNSRTIYHQGLTETNIASLTNLRGERQWAIFQSPDTVINDMRFYTGGATTTIRFIGANGVEYTQDFSANTTVSVDLGAQGLTAPVNILVPYSALNNLKDGANVIFMHNNSITGSIPDWSGWTSGGNIYLSFNKLTGSIPDWSGWTSAKDIRLQSNQLTGSIPDWSGWNNGYVIFLYNNQLTGSIPDWSGWTSGNSIWLFSNQLTNVIGTSIPPTMLDLRLQNNALIQAAVDRVLISLDNAGGTGGNVNLSGGTNAAPSATGLIAKANLESKGWTVLVNS